MYEQEKDSQKKQAAIPPACPGKKKPLAPSPPRPGQETRSWSRQGEADAPGKGGGRKISLHDQQDMTVGGLLVPRDAYPEMEGKEGGEE